jgi:hypothetical protein
VRHRYGNVLLFWIHPLQPAVQQPAGNLCESLQMNDEDDDMIFSLLFVALTVAVVLFVVGGFGVVLWSVFL